ncbi:hypothetical protein ACRALDRAFT_2110574 [Sodiomyces alcalophilus JCM 7366]|uniref:uncharacterized protein n=1 Tax=Sodiomyces alcalophilus JCM 7366 TaxID=591952 RepID=UPI0039B4CDAA
MIANHWNQHPPSINNSSGARSPQNTAGDVSIADVKNPHGPGERSPLLSPDISTEEERLQNRDATSENHDYSQQTKSLWYLILLTISIGGLQIAWSVELSNGSPYLLSLGLSKSLMALVWIAGPLTGTLVQPYVGMLSDNCRLPWGKRKPFMIGGTLATIVSLLLLAWTQEIVGGLLSLLGADPESHPVKVAIIGAAVIGIYILDFAINTVQAAIRAFMVDCAPAHQQEAVNAMASRLTGLGNIVGYCAGYVNLPVYLWFLGNTQFQVLCALASIALGTTVALSTSLIKERDPRLDGTPTRDMAGIFSFFAQIFASVKRLPPQIKRVCQVQFCAWIGFFPLLFYTSSYIGEIYVEPYLRENPNMSPEELDELYEQATRVGTFALLVNSVVSLLTNVFLPFFIAPTYDSHPVLMGTTAESDNISGHKEHNRWSWLDRLHIPGFTLKRAWFGSLVLFAVCMFCTVLVRTVEAATVLIGLAGITWAMTLWAPWAIISAEISRRDALLRASKQRNQSRGMATDGGGPRPRDTWQDGEHGSAQKDDDEMDQAGVILGIHNMAIAAPQMIATIGSSIVFRIWQKPRGTPGDRSMSIVLALGGIAVLISSFFVTRIHETTSAPGDCVSAAEEGEGEPILSRTSPNLQASHQHLPEVSLQRATLTRNKSFGGMEY